MAVRLAVDPNEDLEQLIANLKAQSSKDVVLMLPSETRALQTLDNFYALRNAVRTANISLSFSGGNKTIRGLAKLLGFAVDVKDIPEEVGSPTDMDGFDMEPVSPVSSGRPNGASPFGNVASPPRSSPPDMFADFASPISDKKMKPPPALIDFGNGDQQINRDDMSDFFNPPPDISRGRKNQPPPEPAAGGPGTMTYEDAMRQGIFEGNSPQGDFDFSDDFNDDIPSIPDDNAASEFAKPGRGVRDPDAPRGKPRKEQRPRASRDPNAPSFLTRLKKIIVPVEPRADVMRMEVPELSREEQAERRRQSSRTTLFSVLALLLLVFLVGIAFVVFGNLGGSNAPTVFQSPIALTVPVKTENRTEMVRMLLVPMGSGASSPQAQPTTSTGAAATVITAGVATTTTVSTEPARLPVETVNTGDIKKSGEATVTGIRKLADKAASGEVTFFNSGASSKSYGAGAVIYTAPNGVVYRLVSGLTVAAGNPFAGRNSSAKGRLIADKAGPIGNSDKVLDRYLSDVVGIRIGVMTGGAEREEKFVQQSDMDTLRTQLQGQAKTEANSFLKYDAATQEAIVIKSSEPACTFNKSVNDAADILTGTCIMNIEAVIYSKQAAIAAAQSQLVKGNAKLDSESSVKLANAKLIQEGTNRYLDVEASGRVILNFDVDAFKQAIANKPKTDLTALIAKDYPQINLTQMNFDKITGVTVPGVGRLQVTAVADYQVTPTTGGSSTLTNTLTLPAGGGLPSKPISTTVNP